MNNPKQSSAENMDRISDTNLKELHQAFAEYLETQPWRELHDRTPLTFDHQDPDQRACRVVMGYAGQEYGLAATLGESALDIQTSIATGKTSIPGPQPALHLSATAGHRSMVSNYELQPIQRLGLRYKSNSHYPLWLAVDPGQSTARRANDREAQMMATWLRATTRLVRSVRHGTVERPAIGPQDHIFHPIHCSQTATGAWEFTQTTMRPAQ